MFAAPKFSTFLSAKLPNSGYILCLFRIIGGSQCTPCRTGYFKKGTDDSICQACSEGKNKDMISTIGHYSSHYISTGLFDWVYVNIALPSLTGLRECLSMNEGCMSHPHHVIIVRSSKHTVDFIFTLFVGLVDKTTRLLANALKVFSFKFMFTHTSCGACHIDQFPSG